jgi:hypothetical protein
LIGELLRAEEPQLLLLADLMQACGLLQLTAEVDASEAPVVRARKATLRALQPLDTNGA